MKVERAEVLNALPYERTEYHKEYTYGFKSKSVLTRVGKLKLEIPQFRNEDSLLRIPMVLLKKISEAWEIGKRYLKIKANTYWSSGSLILVEIHNFNISEAAEHPIVQFMNDKKYKLHSYAMINAYFVEITPTD